MREKLPIENVEYVQITKSCLIKINLWKALSYDSVERGFVEEMLHALNFPMKFYKWTMTCISTTQYTISLNGGLYGLH